MTNPAALNREYTNLQQIEVLKGPQGALYGRNAAAGAIIITTEKPGEEWGGKVKGSIAEDDSYLVAGTVGGPVAESLGLSLTGSFRDTDGYYRNRYQATVGGGDDAIVCTPGAGVVYDKSDAGKVDYFPDIPDAAPVAGCPPPPAGHIIVGGDNPCATVPATTVAHEDRERTRYDLGDWLVLCGAAAVGYAGTRALRRYLP